MKTVCAFLHFIAILIILFESVENKKLQKSFEEIFGDGWHLKKIGEEGEEKEEEAKLAQIMGQENDQQRSEDFKKKLIVTDEQKRKIVQEFLTINERIKQQKRGKFSGEQWNKMYRLLAKKLGTNRDKINKWMNELGMGQEIRTKERRMATIRKYWEMKQNDPKMKDVEIAKALKISGTSLTRWKAQFKKREPVMEKVVVTDEQKRKIVREFRAIKEQIKQKGRKYSHKQWDKIEKLLAKKLGTNRRYVYKWSREFGMTVKKRLFFSNEQKIEIVRAFRAIKEEIKQKWKLTRKEWNKVDILLAHKLGTNRCKIYNWINEQGVSQKKIRSNNAKLAIIRQYWAMKRNDPKMSDKKIGKALKISERSMRRWKGRHIE